MGGEMSFSAFAFIHMLFTYFKVFSICLLSHFIVYTTSTPQNVSLYKIDSMNEFFDYFEKFFFFYAQEEFSMLAVKI